MAIRYRKVSTLIWNDEKFCSLSDDGQLLFLMMLTHPHMTSLGAMRTTMGGIAAERGWPFERVSKGFQELSEKGLIKHSETAKCLLLPNFLKHNPPDNPNVIKSWGAALELIPECPLKNELIQLLSRAAEPLGKPFREGFETVAKQYGIPFRIQEQEQEQEQEKKTTTTSPGGDGVVVVVEDALRTPEELVALYNVHRPAECPEVTILSEARSAAYTQYLRQFPSRQWWLQVMEQLHASRYLRGFEPTPSHPNFRAELDWLCSLGQDGRENCVKTYEGKFRTRVATPASPTCPECMVRDPKARWRHWFTFTDEDQLKAHFYLAYGKDLGLERYNKEIAYWRDRKRTEEQERERAARSGPLNGSVQPAS